MATFKHSKLTSTEWASATETYRQPAPKMTGAESTTSKRTTVPGENLLCLPYDEDHNRIYWISIIDSDRWIPGETTGEEGNGLGAPSGGAWRYDPGENYWRVSGVPFYTHPFDKASLLVVCKETACDLYIENAYHWVQVDPAQLLFELTRFHTGGGTDARDELDSASFIAASEYWHDSEPFAQLVSVMVQHEERIADTIRRALLQTNAVLSWQSELLDKTEQALRMDVRHEHTHNTDALDVDNPSSQILRPVQVRYAPEYLVNVRELRMPRILAITDSGTDQVACTEELLPELKNRDATKRIYVPDSIARYGARRAQISAAVFQEHNQAIAGFDVTRWALPTRVVEFSQGLLHYDFLPGDTIARVDAAHGLDGTEKLFVDRKEIDLDTHIATMFCVEERDGATLTPLDIDKRSTAFLYCWFDASQESGYVNGQTMYTIADQSPRGHDGDSLPAGNEPQYATNQINGLPAYDLTANSGQAFWRIKSSGAPSTASIAASESQYMVCAAVFKDSGTSKLRCLFHAAGAYGNAGHQLSVDNGSSQWRYIDKSGESQTFGTVSAGTWQIAVMVVECVASDSDNAANNHKRGWVGRYTTANGFEVMKDDLQQDRVGWSIGTSGNGIWFGVDNQQGSGANSWLNGYVAEAACWVQATHKPELPEILALIRYWREKYAL